MKSEITISVIIPCYNSEKTISACLNSVLTQSESVDEIVVIDDGSTDNSSNIVKEIFQRAKGTIKLNLYQQNNSGPSVARNRGIQLATCSHIAFLDADDEWFVDHIYTVKFFLSKNIDYKIVATKYLSAPIVFTGEVLFERMLLKNYFFTPCIIVNKDLFFDSEVFNEKMKYAEDYYLWLNIIFKNKGYLLDYVGARNITSKRPFGEKGLSSNLRAMHKGVLNCYNSLYLNNMIDFRTYLKIKNIERIKYLRRRMLTFLHKITVNEY